MVERAKGGYRASEPQPVTYVELFFDLVFVFAVTQLTALTAHDLTPDWARTIARRVLYEAADELRLAQLKASAEEDVAGLAAKIDREEVYHRMHAQMWADRLADEPRYQEAVEELFPYALRGRRCRAPYRSAERLGVAEVDAVERGAHVDEWPALWEEMTLGATLRAGCGMVTEAEVWKALAEVADPEIPVVSLVDLGVVPASIRIEDGRVHVGPSRPRSSDALRSR